MLPALPPRSAYFSRNMLIAFCCCWPYEAPLPEDGTRTPIATSACAGTSAAISVEATAAAPIVFLSVVMARSLEVGWRRSSPPSLGFRRHFGQLRIRRHPHPRGRILHQPVHNGCVNEIAIPPRRRL